ncbi:MAG: UvrB/UvrC motif-containing protein [Carboxydocellales bacterium]
MICDNCKERPATVHVTKITNGEKSESNLCEVCAHAQHLGILQQPPNVFDFLSGLFSGEAWGQPVTTAFPEVVKCNNCGISYQEFARSGLLGCSICYDQFAEPLEKVLRRVHGATRHSGKVPERRGGSLKISKELDNLRSQLQQAVAREEFEQAAGLRDRIKELEKSITNVLEKPVDKPKGTAKDASKVKPKDKPVTKGDAEKGGK